MKKKLDDVTAMLALIFSAIAVTACVYILRLPEPETVLPCRVCEPDSYTYIDDEGWRRNVTRRVAFIEDTSGIMYGEDWIWITVDSCDSIDPKSNSVKRFQGRR